MRVPWTARRSNQAILREISPECSLEGLMMLKLKLQYFGHLMRKVDSFEKTPILGKLEGRRRRGQQRMRWLDGITDSMDMLLLLLSCFSCVQLYATPQMAAHHAPLSLGFSRQEYWRGLPFASVMSDSVLSYGQQPTRLLCTWDSLGKKAGVGCHFVLCHGHEFEQTLSIGDGQGGLAC